MTRAGAHRGLLVALAILHSAGVLAQAPPRSSTAQDIQGERAGQTATVSFVNRPIVVFRARVAGRTPGGRARGAGGLLPALRARGATGRVVPRPFKTGGMIPGASRGVR